MAGNKLYKIEYSKLTECSKKDIDEANKQTQLVSALGGQTAGLTFNKCAIFFNDITKTSIMCADSTKEINSKNKVRYPNAIILYVLNYFNHFVLYRLLYLIDNERNT